MNPVWTFLAGLLLLILFGWYFVTDLGRRKRLLGTALTVLLVAFCLMSVYPPKDKIHLGLDLQGGTSFLLRLVRENGQTINKGMVQQAVEVIRKRIDQFGVSEPVITPQGEDRILVQIPGLDAAKTEEARTTLQKVAKLEFKLVHANSDSLLQQIDAGTAFVPPGYEIKEIKEADPTEKPGEKSAVRRLIVKQKVSLGGDCVVSANAYYDNQGYGVALNLNSEGADKFGALTQQVFEEHSRLAILLDGEVQSAPGVEKGAIYGGHAVITGRFTEPQARDLASVLENPLQTPVKIMEERQVSATLGHNAIMSGIYSGAAGLILVAAFMVIYYRLVGFIAIVALAINCIMVVGSMAMFHSVLTLPGIAGLILSLGIAIDANVLIYERLREELDGGKPIKSAVEASYQKAFSAIFDAHVTQFLTAAILFWLASGPVKGFALTLTIGIVASMFSSLLITRTCFAWAFAANLIERITMLHLIRSKGFDFLGHARKFLFASSILVVLSIVVLTVRGAGNFGADFMGGDLLVISATEKITTDQVRNALANTGLQNSVIQAERSHDRDLISIRSGEGTAGKIKEYLSQALPAAGLKFEQTDHVGALVGKELASRSAFALAIGLVGIFLYVSLRFEMSFAIGSIVALTHDLIITLGLFALSGRELSMIMVGAILTIAGYSINDKIVVFDRIRSGLRDRVGGGSVARIMNTSINETLSRTLLTGGTVLLTVLALYFFGGPVLNDFAFSFVVGVLVGTYSSIFIASPIVLWWGGHKGEKLSSEVKRAELAV